MNLKKANGAYHSEFRSDRLDGTGTVLMKDGQATGGDAVYKYSGIYRIDEDERVIAYIECVQKAPGVSVFATMGNFHLELSGKMTESGAVLTGYVVGHPNRMIQMNLTKVAAA